MSQLYTFITAMLPISELRGAIPLGIGVYHLPVLETYILAVIGNIAPILFLLWFWPNLAGYLMKKFSFIDKFFVLVFKITHRKTHQNFQKYGPIALLLFVAIPLPITGAWTGTVAAFLFGIPYWKALGLISAGVLISGAVVVLATIGVTNFI